MRHDTEDSDTTIGLTDAFYEQRTRKLPDLTPQAVERPKMQEEPLGYASWTSSSDTREEKDSSKPPVPPTRCRPFRSRRKKPAESQKEQSKEPDILMKLLDVFKRLPRDSRGMIIFESERRYMMQHARQNDKSTVTNSIASEVKPHKNLEKPKKAVRFDERTEQERHTEGVPRVEKRKRDLINLSKVSTSSILKHSSSAADSEPDPTGKGDEVAQPSKRRRTDNEISALEIPSPHKRTCMPADNDTGSSLDQTP